MTDPRPFLPALAAACLCACAGIEEPDIVKGPDYHALNVYLAAPPADLRRVALLPLTAARDDRNHNAGLRTLEPLLQRGLVARQAFEVAPVSPDWLRRETGRAAWRIDEPLPPDLLDRVMQAHGCDAVLFAHLSDYHPYPPLRVGWRIKLIAGAQARVVWSVDELFDASQPRVVSSARRFYQAHQWGVSANGHSRAILDSPRRFGAYTIAETLGTLGTKNSTLAKVSGPAADQ